MRRASPHEGVCACMAGECGRGVVEPVPAGPSVFDLSVSTRPGASEEAGRREKTKNLPRWPLGPLGPRNQPKTQEFPPEPRRARPPGRKSVFLRIELGPGRGHFSLENGLSDTWIAKVLRCAHLRTWGTAPQDQETPSRTLTPSLWRRRRHPVSLDRGPRGRDQKRSALGSTDDRALGIRIVGDRVGRHAGAISSVEEASRAAEFSRAGSGR